MSKFDYKTYVSDNWLLKESLGPETDQPESEQPEQDMSPESIIRDSGNTTIIIGKGEGFDLDQIAAALKKGYEDQVEDYNSRYKQFRQRDLAYAYWDFDINPDKNGVSILQVNPTGTYKDHWGEMKVCTFEEGAKRVAEALTHQVTPKELQPHVKGWIITNNHHYRPGIYPLLDPEGVAMYKAARDKVDSEISAYYASKRSGEYCGD